MSISKESKPILLTVILITVAFVVFFANRLLPQNSIFPSETGDLTILLWLFFVIDIGFIVALILGVRTKKPSVVWFSIITNSIFFVLLSGLIFLLAIANGISEP
ncbi:hypothetical protein ABEY50_01370 [Priestia megaterium]|uniref:hypothetical protein n=1 Tax=Priestia megaterium TaxID=1404 RepID=UPI000BFBEC7E|nr:hypothetical protein [Priestia megaterium]MEB2293551.1 hypothetical protein [Priestia megaterium]PGK28584.1 hypothetical protein CN902_16025 [Priestia megaterium]